MANVLAYLPGLATLPMASDEGGFHGPSITDFFPPAILFEGTIFEFNRIMMVRLISAVTIALLFMWMTRRMTLVPSRKQSLAELSVGVVRDAIAINVLGEKKGRQYATLLTVIFWTVLAMNITGVIPGLNIAGSSVVGVPLVMALVAWVGFIYAGVKEQGGLHFLKASLFPPGVPWPIYFILAPIEFISTFLLRPVTLTIRLLANMISGHFVLVLCFAGTNYLLLEASAALKPLGLLTLVAAVIFTLFEIFIAALQAFIFTLLTSVYIQLSTEAH